MPDYPAVSCICLTYGRPRLLEEALESFLLQSYPGRKELVVLNDYGRQHLVFEHPDVRVINLTRRFRTVGEKCNAAVGLASNDLLFVWDDDDVYLPHRLAFSVDRFDAQKGFFKPERAWMLEQGNLQGPTANVFHVGSCWSRDLFDQVRGYAAMGNGYDQEIEARFEETRPGSTATYDIRDDEIYYIYRWNGTGSYHMSAFGRETPGENVEQHAVEEYIDAQVQSGAMAEGRIELSPHWERDYEVLAQNHLRQR